MEAGGKIIVLLPGPPHELEAICEKEVWPRLAARKRSYLARRQLKTAGLTESELEVMIEGLYPREPGLSLTVLASPGQIDLQVTSASSESAAEADARAEELAGRLAGRLGLAVFSEDGADLETVIGRLLAGRNQSVAVAESCTGGLISRRLTRVPGSSAYFWEGFITYGNKAKIARLGVPEDLIERHGAVSADTAGAMAEGARRTAGCDFGLAVTGIAGPTGATPEKPIGLVFCSVADARRVRVERWIFLGDRIRVQEQSAQKTLDMFRRRLLEDKDR